MDDEEIERLEETEVVKGEELTLEGNTFKGLSSTIQTYVHIRNVYKKVLRDPEFACVKHNIRSTDSRMWKAVFTMDIAAMVNTGPVDGC